MSTTTKTKRAKSKIQPVPGLKTIRLSLSCPLGDTVGLAGSFNDWQPVALQREGSNWHIELLLAPGEYEYLFVINGRWVTDPVCTEGRPNPYGGENSVLRVPAG